MGLAGCSSGGGGGGEDISVGMVYTAAGLGDEGFNDSAQDGLLRAEEELGVSVEEIEPGGSDQYAPSLRQLAKKDYDLVCGLSFEMQTAMKNVASDFPDQKFTIVDTSVDLDNVASYLYKEHEGCYLVGKSAAMLTQREFSAGGGKTNSQARVGFLGGKRNPVIEKFHAGFEAGVASLSTDVAMNSAYAGTWSSPSKGKSIAESMYNDGADIVFPAAGGTGLGVFQAAQERSRYAYGVDKKQSEATPEYANVILGSMVKRVGNTFYRSIQNVIEDQFKGGTTQTLGIEKKGVDLVWGSELGSKIPSEVKTTVSETRQGIIDGDITVPSTTYE
ncbi:MAG: BMP family protein [Halobacteriaceae archaeon]